MPIANVYKIAKKGFLIYSSVTSTSGVMLAAEPFIRIDEHLATPIALVDAIKRAFQTDNKKEVPHPGDWKKFQQEYLSKTGLKSWSELEQPTTKRVTLYIKDNLIHYTATKPAKPPGKGFVPTKDVIEIPADSSDAVIYETLEFAFQKCNLV